MAITTITQVGALSQDVVDQLNANFSGVATGNPLITPEIQDGLTATGSATNDFSGSTGAFKTSSGTGTLSGNTSVASGKTLTLSQNTGVLSGWKVVPATTYTSNNTPALITGLSWTLVAGTYVFELNLPTTMTTVGGLTVQFGLTTAVLTSINYQSYAATASDNTTAVSTNGTTTTSGTSVFDSKAAAYTHVNIKGLMVVGTGGTFQWNASQNTSAGGGDATSLLVNGYATMTRIA